MAKANKKKKASHKTAKKNGPKIGVTYSFDLDLGGVFEERKAIYLGKTSNNLYVFEYANGATISVSDLENGDIKNLQQVID